jgi:hypothetical protein
MTSSAIELESARATSVDVTDKAITIDLEDGRTVSVPTEWYPRLLHATTKERANFEITEAGVIWPDVDADFSIRGVLLGRKSAESPASFKFWLDARREGRQVTLADFSKSLRQSKTGKTSRSRTNARRGKQVSEG